VFGADVSVAALKMLFVGVIAGDCNKYDPTQAIVMGDELYCCCLLQQGGGCCSVASQSFAVIVFNIASEETRVSFSYY